MSEDPFGSAKAAQREAWARFGPMEAITTPPAAHLVTFAGISSGEKVLDVGCGTGVAAVTAACRGAQVSGIDLSPVLIERAQFNAQIAGHAIRFIEGDVEALPYGDGEFDVVISQFGHMYAPRPEVAISEMLRVLRPGGRIAFSTWPPHLYTGRMIALNAKYVPPADGVPALVLWGVPSVIKERLGDRVKDLIHDQQNLISPAMSPKHVLRNIENVGPIARLVQTLDENDPRLSQFRTEADSLIAEYFNGNLMRQPFLMTRAIKV